MEKQPHPNPVMLPLHQIENEANLHFVPLAYTHTQKCIPIIRPLKHICNSQFISNNDVLNGRMT